jgi:carbon-monoxide dehydrogenase medium subunit
MQLERYAAPRSVSEAIALLGSREGAPAQVLAGGTDLLVQLRSGRIEAHTLLDLKRIPELMAARLGAEGLRLGAALSCAQIREIPGLQEVYPGLFEAVALIGSEQIQGRASVGGNLCNASPAADTVPALIALGAECIVAGPGGSRAVPAEEFVRGPGRTALGPGELLVELRVPPPPPRSADAYLRFIPRSEMDIAVVGAGVWLQLDGSGRCAAARVALGAVAPTPLLVAGAASALIGSRFEDAALEAAAAAARAACRPIDDKRGTADYRRTLAGVLVKRATRSAADRARSRT